MKCNILVLIIAFLLATCLPITSVKAQSAAKFYGTPWQAEGLSNLAIKDDDADIRFRATHTAAFKAAKFYFIFATYQQRSYCNQPPFSSSHPNNCYGGGTGGIIRVQLQADDGTSSHRPNGIVLAQATITDPMNHTQGAPIYGNSAGDSNFRVVSNFTAAPMLMAGEIYHLVLSNTHRDTANNFVSIDSLDITTTTNCQPGVSDTDLAQLITWDNRTWSVRSETPVFEIFYQDGFIQGQGYMGTRVTYAKTIAGSAKARQTFKVSGGDKHVKSVSVRLKSGSNPGSLAVRLEKADGTLIEKGTIPASAFSTSSYKWATYTFTTARTLTSGQSYNLVLSAASGNGYRIYPLQKGSSYGFSSATFFPDGHADYSSGSGWAGSSISSWGTTTMFDYQLYFTLG